MEKIFKTHDKQIQCHNYLGQHFQLVRMIKITSLKARLAFVFPMSPSKRKFRHGYGGISLSRDLKK